MSPQVWNTLVEGDNLEVMTGLADGSIDLICTDPPYNTGNDFAYRDAAGRPAERHQAWAAMMRPRVEQMWRVLALSGALFVSIDDNEVHHLRVLLDEVFGERNFLAQLVVNLNPKGRQLGRGFATSHEYVLVYARDLSQCVLEAATTDTVVASDFTRTAPDGRKFRYLPLRNTNKRFNPLSTPTLHYPLYGDPVTGRVATTAFAGAQEVTPVFGDGSAAVWRWSPPRVEDRTDDLECRAVTGRLGQRVDVFQRDWLHEGRRKKLRTIWLAEEIGSTDTAVAELKALVGHTFETPKPTGLVRRILATMPSDVRVLDPFAGSGTTGHAVALANAADGGSRHCLSIELGVPPRPNSKAAALGFASMAQITRSRLSAVANSVGGGLREG